MSKAPKLVLIGAGSAVFGMKTIATVLQSKRLRGLDFWLVDIDEPALELMTRLAERLNQEWDAGMRIHGATDRHQALPGADFVVVSVQVGHRETVWEKDWRIPLKHGIRQPYAENSGPGAFAHTARNLPLMIAIAEDMQMLCPDAWYLNYTNPLIRLTQGVARYTGVKIVGMCHQLEWAYAMVMALLGDRYGVAVPEGFHVHTDYSNRPRLIRMREEGLKRFDIKAAGLNHFSWIFDIRDKVTGEDLYPLVRERWLGGDQHKDFEPLTRELFQIFGLMATPGDSHLCEYLQWVHDPISKPWEKYDLKLQSWSGNLDRRADRRGLARAVADGQEPADRLLDQRSEGVREIVEAMTFNDNLYHHQLNLPNQGQVPNLPHGAIVETPGVISGLGIRPLAMPPLPEPIAELCRRELAYSSLVVDACYFGDKERALQALLLDPMVNDIDRARAILADFYSEFAEYMPQFSET